MSSCSFQITNQRVAYKIDITTAYENGNTDFGGNNLTYRVMQLLKLALARELGGDGLPDPQELISSFDMDVFRRVDRDGVAAVYADLDNAYHQAEKILPTRFREYEHSSRADTTLSKIISIFYLRRQNRLKKPFTAKRISCAWQCPADLFGKQLQNVCWWNDGNSLPDRMGNCKCLKMFRLFISITMSWIFYFVRISMGSFGSLLRDLMRVGIG